MQHLQELMKAADRLAEATTGYLERTSEARDLNEAVIDTLPDKDERGSFDWWAAFCRQYTGRSFLDSGGHYGYTFERPVRSAPLVADTHRGKLNYFSISTPHYLHRQLDATDPVAVAIEEVLYWIGDNVDADSSWVGTMNKMVDVLYELVCLAQSKGKSFGAYRYGDKVRAYLNTLGPVHFHGPSRYDKTNGLPEDWAETFPWDALDTIADGDVGVTPLGGGNTYNYDNDLDQVLQYDTISVSKGQRYEFERPMFVMVQAHTGCDVRGGYTRPVVARVKDYEFFASNRVELRCATCDTWWESHYFYTKAMRDHDSDAPPILVDGEAMDPEGGFKTVPAEAVELLCPHCENHTVNPTTMALH